MPNGQQWRHDRCCGRRTTRKRAFILYRPIKWLCVRTNIFPAKWHDRKDGLLKGKPHGDSSPTQGLRLQWHKRCKGRPGQDFNYSAQVVFLCHAIARAPYEPAGISVNGRSSALLSARRKLPGKLFSLNVSEQNAPTAGDKGRVNAFLAPNRAGCLGKGGLFFPPPGIIYLGV